MKERQRLEIQGKDIRLIWRQKIKKATGRAGHDTCTIEVKRGLPEDRTIATVIHEALHIIDDELELKLDHDTINRLESALYAFLKKSGADLKPLIYEPEGNA